MRDKRKSKIQKENKKNQKRDNTYSLESYRKKKGLESNPYQNRNYSFQAEHKPYRTPYDSPYTKDNPYKKREPIPQRNNPYDPSFNQQKKKSSKTLEVKRRSSSKQLKKARKKKKVFYGLRIIVAFIGIILGVFSAIKVMDILMKPTVSYQTVKAGFIDNSVVVTGVIVREENVIRSERGGELYYLTDEGHKVSKEGEVCYIGEISLKDSIQDQISEIDTSIYTIQKQREAISTYQPEVNTLNQKIQTQMKTFYLQYQQLTQTTPIYLLRKELEHVIQTRTTLYASDITDRLESLQEDRMELTEEIHTLTNVVTSAESGIVSYYVDGLEETVSKENLSEIDYGLYREIINKKESIKPIMHAEEGEPLYKLVTDQRWYLVTYLAKEEALSYKEGELYDLYFEGHEVEKVTFKIEQITEEGDQTQIIFSCDEQVSSFLPYRKVAFTIGKNRANGLKIPLTAIVEKNILGIPNEYIVSQGGLDGVIIQKEGQAVFTPITKEFIEGNKTYIMQEFEGGEQISLGETIQHPETEQTYILDELKMIQGVYVVNSRYTEFKKVELLLTNKEYAILDEKESELKPYDQMISNPKNVNENELLKNMNVQNE